ncbi:DUF6894 family protein [Methylobacterium sp. CM6246]
MPRYHFNIRDGDVLTRDRDGSDLPSMEAARADAIASARYLHTEKIKAGDVIDDRCFEIADAVGRVLAVLPFKGGIRSS